MRVAIFYVLTPIHDGPFDDVTGDYWSCFSSDQDEKSGARIRMEIVEADGVEAALDMAQPRAGEAVMNTHEVAD